MFAEPNYGGPTAGDIILLGTSSLRSLPGYPLVCLDTPIGALASSTTRRDEITPLCRNRLRTKKTACLYLAAPSLDRLCLRHRCRRDGTGAGTGENAATPTSLPRTLFAGPAPLVLRLLRGALCAACPACPSPFAGRSLRGRVHVADPAKRGCVGQLFSVHEPRLQSSTTTIRT